MKKLDLTAARAAPPSEHNNDDDLMEQLASPRCVSSGAVEGVMFVYQKGAGLLEPSWKKRYCIVPPNDHHIMIYRLQGHEKSELLHTIDLRNMHVEVTQESKSASMLAWSKKNTMRYEFAIWSVAPDTTSTTTTSTTSSAGISGGSIARMGSSDSSLLNRPQPTLSSSDGIPRGKPLPRAPTSSDAHASSPPISKPLPSPDSRSSSPMPGKSYAPSRRRLAMKVNTSDIPLDDNGMIADPDSQAAPIGRSRAQSIAELPAATPSDALRFYVTSETSLGTWVNCICKASVYDIVSPRTTPPPPLASGSSAFAVPMPLVATKPLPKPMPKPPSKPLPRPVPTVPSGDDEEERERLRREAEEEELERQRREEEERRRIELLRLQSAITLQSWYRCVQQMRSFHHELREHRAATKIQSHWRRVVATRKVSFIQKENNYRKRVITELWQTEQSYLQSLELLLEVYHTPLSQNGLLSDDKRQSLFSNVDSIFQLHTVLLQQLEPKLLPERTPTAERGWFPHRKIAHIFLALNPQFKLYTAYVNNYDTAAALCEQLQSSNQKFRAFCQQADKNPRCKGLSLLSYLIMPVQRLPRYSMLLKDILKHTWPEHADRAALEKAVAAIDDTTTFINESKRENENAAKMAVVQRRLQPKSSRPDVSNLELMQAHRKYIKEGELNEYYLENSKEKVEQRFFFLFNDMFMCSNQKHVRQIKLKGIHQTTRFEPIYIIDWDQTTVFNAPTAHDEENRKFVIQTPKGPRLYEAATTKERDGWVAAINQVMSQFVEER